MIFFREKYFRTPVMRIIRNAMFEPLTTRIWDVPLCIKASFISRERLEIDPMVIPRRVPEISFGK
jgi:hypothetical protein